MLQLSNSFLTIKCLTMYYVPSCALTEAGDHRRPTFVFGQRVILREQLCMFHSSVLLFVCSFVFIPSLADVSPIHLHLFYFSLFFYTKKMLSTVGVI